MMRLISIILVYGLLSVLNSACSSDEPKSSYMPDFTITPHPIDANVYVFETLPKANIITGAGNLVTAIEPIESRLAIPA